MPPDERTSDVLVVGGGLHGCSAALHLAMRGVSVTVLEKDHVGRHASGVNAGGVRRLGRDLAEVPISLAATAYWQDIRALVDDDCGYRQSRQLKVAETEEELDAARRRVDLLRQHGFEHEEVVDRETLREMEPNIGAQCVGAIHVAGDGSALPFRTTTAFRRRAARLGVRFIEGAPVTGVRQTSDGWTAATPVGVFSGGAIVNAAGAWAGRIAGLLGDEVPVIPKAPMLAVTAPVPAFSTAVFGALGDALSLKQYGNGTVLLGGGILGRPYPDENRTELDVVGVAKFLSTAKRIVPALADATVVRTWAGIEAYMPDDLPVVGLGGAPGVVHAFGFSGHGFQLAPAVGRIVADLVLEQAADLPIAGLRYDRFDGGRAGT